MAQFSLLNKRKILNTFAAKPCHPNLVFEHCLTLCQPGGGLKFPPPPSRFFLRHRHKNQLIDFKLSDFSLLLSRHNLSKNQVHNLSGGHIITLLSETLCFTTYLSLYFHRISCSTFFFFLTFMLSVN